MGRSLLMDKYALILLPFLVLWMAWRSLGRQLISAPNTKASPSDVAASTEETIPPSPPLAPLDTWNGPAEPCLGSAHEWEIVKIRTFSIQVQCSRCGVSKSYEKTPALAAAPITSISPRVASPPSAWASIDAPSPSPLPLDETFADRIEKAQKARRAATQMRRERVGP